MSPSAGLPPPSPADAYPPSDITLLGLVAFLMAHKRVILGTGLAAFLLVGVITFIRHRTYSSSAMFMPQSSEGSLSRLSGLAASFGVAVPPVDPGSSPSFYEDLLKSRDILRRTVETRYAFVSRGDSIRGTLIELFDERGDTPAIRRDAAAKDLLDNIDVGVSRENGTVSLKVTTDWAELSRLVAGRMIELVSDFNLNRRQTKAGAERRFVEGRVSEVRDSLRAAEAVLQAFLQRNRDYKNSPPLLFEYERLDRDVTMKQQVYTSLVQSFEAARIDEVRNTPVITVMEPPDLAARPDPRLAVLKGMLAGILGLMLGAFYAAVRQALAGLPLVARPPRTRQEAADSPSAFERTA